MKIHRLLAEAAAGLCAAVFDRGHVLDHALAATFAANPRWGKRDRAFVASTVFEVVRWRRALAFLAESTDPAALCALHWLRSGYAVPDWWPQAGAGMADLAAREAALTTQPRAVRESLPDWLDGVGAVELGGLWDGVLAALNQRAPVFLRVNTLTGTRAATREWLAANGVETRDVPGLPDALVLPPGKTLPRPLLGAGRVEIQDAASQRIAPLLDARPGERVVDACAGAGGKSLHLAARIHNHGRIDAFDVDPRKIAELQRRAHRAGATCIHARATGPETLRRLTGAADRLLVDAPCSGLGTLRRQPDLKWRLTPERLDRVRRTQRDLLASYPAMLRPGGTLVYATCSVLPSENRGAVDALLERGGFTLARELNLPPAAGGGDGFYAAVLEKHP